MRTLQQRAQELFAQQHEEMKVDIKNPQYLNQGFPPYQGFGDDEKGGNTSSGHVTPYSAPHSPMTPDHGHHNHHNHNGGHSPYSHPNGTHGHGHGGKRSHRHNKKK